MYTLADIQGTTPSDGMSDKGFVQGSGKNAFNRNELSVKEALEDAGSLSESCKMFGGFTSLEVCSGVQHAPALAARSCQAPNPLPDEEGRRA